MVQENEIKCGNWFNHKAVWSYRNFESSSLASSFNFQFESRDWYALGECTLSLEDIEPIPLTEQWLLDLGFHKDNYGIYELVKDNKPYISGCEIELWAKHCIVGAEWFWDISVGKDFGSTENFAYINYVHQLQNIAFLKTGTELIYNPTT